MRIGLPSSALNKAKKKGQRKKPRHPGAPSGYTAVKNSKHNGYRKMVGDHWAYWYPDEHKDAPHLDWEDDLSLGSGTRALKPGAFVGYTGSPGVLFSWVPDAGDSDADTTWIVAFDSAHNRAVGKPVKVKRSAIQGQRSFDPAERRRKRKRTTPIGVSKDGRHREPPKSPKWQDRHVKPGTKKPKKRRRVAPPPISTGATDEAEAAERRSQKERRGRVDELIAKIEEAKELLARTGRRRLRSPDRIAALKMAIAEAQKHLRNVKQEVGGPGQLTDAPAESIRSKVYENSTAKPGTFLHKLENGHYPLTKFGKGDRHFGHDRLTHGIFIPPQDVAQIFEEFGDIIANPAFKVARTYGIKSKPELDDVVSGSKLGFLLALRTYTGGVPFEVHARRYATVYAGLAARDIRSGGAATIPKEQMQNLHGLIAAKARATAKAQGFPTVNQVARSWYLTKKATFTGRSTSLGIYPHPDKRSYRTHEKTGKRVDAGPILVDQSKEQVPLEDWQIKGPDGKPRGRTYPGKLSLVREMSPILDGSRVEDSEWINQNEGRVLPVGADSTLPVGMQYQLREDIEAVTSKLPAKQRELLSILFGFEEDKFPGTPKASHSKTRPMKFLQPLPKGEDYPVSAVELSDRMGLAPLDASVRTKQKKAEAAAKIAVQMFQEKSAELRLGQVGARIKRWGAVHKLSRPDKAKTPTGPTHKELSDRFGGDDKVAIYAAAIRAGKGSEVAKKLDKLKAGKLSAGERDALMEEHIERRDAERLAAFQRQTATTEVDPSEVRETRGTPGSADWLYTPELEAGYLRALHRKHSSGAAGENRESRVWSDARFQDFMGRGEQYRSALKETEDLIESVVDEALKDVKEGDNE